MKIYTGRRGKGRAWAALLGSRHNFPWLLVLDFPYVAVSLPKRYPPSSFDLSVSGV